MTLSTLENFKELFRVEGATSNDYSKHLSGEAILEVNEKQKEVNFIRRHLSMPIAEVDDCPIVLLGGDAYLLFRRAVKKDEAERLLDVLVRRLGGALGGNAFHGLPFFGGQNSHDVSSHFYGEYIDEVLENVADRKRSHSDVERFVKNLPENDAPPCVQSYMLKFPNCGGDAVATYLKAKGDALPPSMFGDEKRAFHEKNTVPYECSLEPLCLYCDSDECARRKYRPDGGWVSTLKFGQLKRYDAGDEAFYVWKINDQDVRFDDEGEFINQSRFTQNCVRSLGILPTKMNETAWRRVVNTALKGMGVVPKAKIDKVLPDQLRHIIMHVKSRVVIDDRIEYTKLVQGWIYLHPATFVFVVDALGFCAFANANFKSLYVKDFQSFTRALRRVGFKKAKRRVEGSIKDVWTCRLSDITENEKEWNKYVLEVSKGTVWEDNIKSLLGEPVSGRVGLTEDEKRLIEKDALTYIDTRKEG